MPPDVLEALKPEAVVPAMLVLAARTRRPAPSCAPAPAPSRRPTSR